MRAGARLRLFLPLAALLGCVYYNAMWTAERLARDARRAEASGQDGEARGLWQRAAIKAESVVVRHPRSRWTDDAIVLRAEALVRAGNCDAAALDRARRLGLEGDLGERTALAAAECALAAGRAAEAGALLAPMLDSRNAVRRARATYLAGRAAWATWDGAGAAALLARSTHPAAAPARVHVLLATGRSAEALGLLDTLAGRRFVESEWVALLDSAALRAGPAAASTVLDRLLARGRVPADAAARLLLADGDRRAAAREPAAAVRRFDAAAAIAPDATGAELARLRRLRSQAARAASVADLAPLQHALAGSRAAGDHAALRTALAHIADRASDVSTFRAAEVARDVLQAERLAGSLFLELVGRWPASPFAPKAIVAAMALDPERRDSLAAVLDAAYPGSPYTRALRGEVSASFVAAEDSLARALGIASVLATPSVGRALAPRPGPRTVALEPPVPSAPETLRRAPETPRPQPERPARPGRPPAERPTQ